MEAEHAQLAVGIMESMKELLDQCRLFDDTLREIETTLPATVGATDGIASLHNALRVQNQCLAPASVFTQRKADKLRAGKRGQSAKTGTRLRAVAAPRIPATGGAGRPARAGGVSSRASAAASAHRAAGARSRSRATEPDAPPTDTMRRTARLGASKRQKRRNDEELLARLPAKYRKSACLQVLRRLRSLVSEAGEAGMSLSGAREAMQLMAGEEGEQGQGAGLVKTRMTLSQASGAMDLLLRMGWAERRAPAGRPGRSVGSQGLVYVLAGPPKRGRKTAGLGR